MSGDIYRGERIGKYHVLTQLSVGGMAELFVGFTSGPGGFRKYVVLKRILPDARSDENFERMFLDEARITAAFNHPNIAQVFELGQDEGLFLAMEFIAGQNLIQVARACQRRGKPLPAGFSLAVARDVCLALHYAHTFTTPTGKASPVIHRDVAQKNVMVRYDGVVKLLDFGIAKARGSLGRTQVGMVKGTTGYMSPEQVRGDPLDARSDLFAVGVMLYEMLAGERLFSAQTELEEMMMILEAPIPELEERAPGVPREVASVVMKALERDREARFASGREMAKALESAGGGLLFDEEQRAALMRELFEERMLATNQLLESADEAEEEQVRARAVRALTGEELSVVSEDVGRRPIRREQGPRPVREEERRRVPAGKRKVVPAGNREDASAGSRETRQATPAVVKQVAPPVEVGEKKKGSGGLVWALVVGVLMMAGAYGALELAPRLEEPAVPPPVGEPSPTLPIYPEPKLPVFPEPGTEEARAEGAAQPSPEAPKETERSEREPARRVKQGALTLVVLPEAEVYRGRVSLGKTPLFEKAMPVGTHLLRIKGADGKKRVLSVPIQEGKTAVFKLKLEEIPER
ncbi:MAG TPA: protein kinase [Myxococcaceae bacterium]|nr:protein kinase [Myxococcaceae bacterium]